MRSPRASVVADNVEGVMPQFAHQRDLIGGHLAERVLRDAFGFRAIAIAAQIGRHHGEFTRQRGDDPMPHGSRLRKPVQQQQRRTAAALRAGDRLPVHLHLRVGQAR